MDSDGVKAERFDRANVFDLLNSFNDDTVREAGVFSIAEDLMHRFDVGPDLLCDAFFPLVGPFTVVHAPLESRKLAVANLDVPPFAFQKKKCVGTVPGRQTVLEHLRRIAFPR